jgi:hypothetical protein
MFNINPPTTTGQSITDLLVDSLSQEMMREMDNDILRNLKSMPTTKMYEEGRQFLEKRDFLHLDMPDVIVDETIKYYNECIKLGLGKYVTLDYSHDLISRDGTYFTVSLERHIDDGFTNNIYVKSITEPWTKPTIYSDSKIINLIFEAKFIYSFGNCKTHTIVIAEVEDPDDSNYINIFEIGRGWGNVRMVSEFWLAPHLKNFVTSCYQDELKFLRRELKC